MSYAEEVGALTRKLEVLYYRKRKTIAALAAHALGRFPDHTVHRAPRELTLIAPAGATTTFLFGRRWYVVRVDADGRQRTYMSCAMRPAPHLNAKTVGELRHFAAVEDAVEDEGL